MPSIRVVVSSEAMTAASPSLASSRWRSSFREYSIRPKAPPVDGRGNRALGDAHAEQLGQQPAQPLETDMVAVMQIEQKGMNVGAEWRARRHAVRWLGFEALAALSAPSVREVGARQKARPGRSPTPRTGCRPGRSDAGRPGPGWRRRYRNGGRRPRAAARYDRGSSPAAEHSREVTAAASSPLDHLNADLPSDPSTAVGARSATSAADARPCRPKPSPTPQCAPPARHSPAPGPARAARVPHEKDAITDWAWAHSSRQSPKSGNPLPADRSVSVAFQPTW